MKNSTLKLFLLLISSLTLSASACDKERAELVESELDKSVVSISYSYCDSLAYYCLGLAELAILYPTEIVEPYRSDYEIHPELLSYIIDTLPSEVQDRHNLPKICPDLTRRQIRCALGEPNSHGGTLRLYDTGEIVTSDDYSFSRGLIYGIEPSPFWKEPFYMVSVYYRDNGQLAFIVHSGL